MPPKANSTIWVLPITVANCRRRAATTGPSISNFDNLAPVNYLTLCAATLPVGLDRLGMPVGLQLIAKGGDDERLVAIACAAERVLGAPRDILGAPPMCRG